MLFHAFIVVREHKYCGFSVETIRLIPFKRKTAVRKEALLVLAPQYLLTITVTLMTFLATNVDLGFEPKRRFCFAEPEFD